LFPFFRETQSVYTAQNIRLVRTESFLIDIQFGNSPASIISLLNLIAQLVRKYGLLAGNGPQNYTNFSHRILGFTQNGETLCPVTLARAKTLLEPRFFPLSHKGLDKMKISVYTPNYERTLASTKRSSIG
jgi:hypothetical protein